MNYINLLGLFSCLVGVALHVYLKASKGEFIYIYCYVITLFNWLGVATSGQGLEIAVKKVVNIPLYARKIADTYVFIKPRTVQST